MQNIVIFGATSAIAESTARIYAERGDRLFLVARNEQRLKDIVTDLQIRGAQSVDYLIQDLGELDQLEACIAKIKDNFQRLDVVLLAHGTLSDQPACEQSLDLTLTELKTNGLSFISLLTLLANEMEQQKTGSLAIISSVAGDRGRQSNYVYGSAKSLVSTFSQGLRNRLSKQNVQVLTVKPGFVDTPMTAHLPKGALWAKPEQLADGIVKAIEKKKDVVYLPGFWRYIMLIIMHIPEFVFKRLSL